MNHRLLVLAFEIVIFIYITYLLISDKEIPNYLAISLLIPLGMSLTNAVILIIYYILEFIWKFGG